MTSEKAEAVSRALSLFLKESSSKKQRARKKQRSRKRKKKRRQRRRTQTTPSPPKKKTQPAEGGGGGGGVGTEDIPSYDEFLDTTRVRNPDNPDGPEVTLRTLKTKDKDSQAYKTYQQYLQRRRELLDKARDSVDDVGEVGTSAPDPEEGDTREDSLEDADTHVIVEQAVEDIKEKGTSFLQSNKDRLKGALNKILPDSNGDFGDLINIGASLILTLLDSGAGESLLERILEDIGSGGHHKEQMVVALSNIKSSELHGMLNEEARETLHEELGIALEPNVTVQVPRLLRALEEGGGPLDDNIVEELFAFFTDISDEHIAFLEKYVNPSTGDIDLKRLKADLRLGLPKAQAPEEEGEEAPSQAPRTLTLSSKRTRVLARRVCSAYLRRALLPPSSYSPSPRR